MNNTQDLTTLTIAKASALLRKKELSSLELTKECFLTIEKREPEIHAFLSLDREGALEAARAADARLAKGEPLEPLTGIPCAIKDAILVRGFAATAGSKILEHYRAPYDATVIQKLRTQGAVILGKTNLDEFAMGSSTENSAFGPTKNPHDTSRVPGGSSGGSAAALAAHECLFSLGSDTGGSVRQPASFCGVVGLKPTYGAVSRYGLVALASSLDQIGPFAKTVEDCAVVFGAISGRDPRDATTSPEASYAGLARDVCQKIDVRKLVIGVPKEYFGRGLESEIERAVRRAIDSFMHAGAKIQEVSLPHIPYALACYYIILPAEASANLARYDGIRYGLSETATHDLSERYFRTRGKGFGAEPRLRIMLGTFVLSAGYYDAYYAKAQRVRRLIRDDFLRAFKEVDVIFAPTSPVLPFRLGERTQDPLSMYLADVYTVPSNLAGLPTVSIPCGTAKTNEGTNLPIGLQIIGKPFDEKTILQVAYAYERSAQ